MKIVLLDVQTRKTAVNKTMAGGFGTASAYNAGAPRSFLVSLLERVKKAGVRIPLLEFAYLARIFKDKGHTVMVSYGEGLPFADLYLIYVSLIEFNQEIEVARKIKESYPRARVGFIGTLATVRTDLLTDYADFVVKGESEGFFLNYGEDYLSLEGVVEAGQSLDPDALPFPDWSVFDMRGFIHCPFFGRRSVYPILGSRGCPFSCRYYCAYPLAAGTRVRYRQLEEIIKELKYLVRVYAAKAVLFRDANFSVDLERAKRLCQRMMEEQINIHWACETHLNCMDKELVDLMYVSGCRAITVGIESRSEEVICSLHRRDVAEGQLEGMVKYCEGKGIKIMAGYIFGSLQDTAETILETIAYAKRLNTTYAQFYISTPYPGTEYFKDLEDRINVRNWERFDTYTLVFNHPCLSEEQLSSLKQKAYIQYYFRFRWIMKFIRSKICDFFDRW